MQKATNYIRGSVRLEAVGPYPERFFNICAARGIRFWKVERVDETTVRLTVALSQARQAQALGPKCLCEVTKIGEEGALHFLGQFRSRYGLLAGLALSLLAVLVLSRFVLVIDITGNTAVPDGVILSELRESGLAPGVYGPSLDERSIANRALMELEELSFLSVNLRGIRAEVVVRESDPAPEVEPTGVASDLIAEKSGVILDLHALAGQPLVGEGDTVEAGDVLVSGTVTITREDDPSQVISSYPVLAKGSVWAEVEEQFSAAIPLNCLQKAYTGRVRREYELVILGQSFKISPKAFQPFAYYDKIECSWDLTLSGGLKLPFSLVVREGREYLPETAELSRAGAEEYLRALLENRLAEAVGDDGAVLEQQWDVEERDGALTVTVTARCREQIAVSGTED